MSSDPTPRRHPSGASAPHLRIVRDDEVCSHTDVHHEMTWACFRRAGHPGGHTMRVVSR